MKFLKLFLYPILFSSHLVASLVEPQVILLFGTSCAGKSTLARALHKSLESWKVLDWDDYGNEFSDDSASEMLLEAVREGLSRGHSLIVDTQPGVDFTKILMPYHVVSILVYAPLETLLLRDNLRRIKFNRSERRARYATAYIYNTFFQLFGTDPKGTFVDQVIPEQVEKNLYYYPLNDEVRDFFQKIAQAEIPVAIYAKKPYDLIIKTDQLEVEAAVELVCSKL